MRSTALLLPVCAQAATIADALVDAGTRQKIHVLVVTKRSACVAIANGSDKKLLLEAIQLMHRRGERTVA
jgi:hypothetical protein